MTQIMLDSVQPPELAWAIAHGYKPAALGAYVAGNWVTIGPARQLAAQAGIRVLSIAPFASADAQCLDIEAGDASPAQAPAWVRRQHARGVGRPVLYASASMMGAVRAMIRNAGIPRDSIRLWSAHYNGQPHICGPETCAYPSCPAVDGTQWADSLAGHVIDQSVLADDFFTTAAAPAQPAAPAFLEDPMLLKQGKGAKTPIALTKDAKAVRFFSNLAAEVDVDVRDGNPMHNLKLGYDSAHTVDIPADVHAIVAHRVDDGDNDVSAVVLVG
jgi:hypothetical protein